MHEVRESVGQPYAHVCSERNHPTPESPFAMAGVAWTLNIYPAKLPRVTEIFSLKRCSTARITLPRFCATRMFYHRSSLNSLPLEPFKTRKRSSSSLYREENVVYPSRKRLFDHRVIWDFSKKFSEKSTRNCYDYYFCFSTREFCPLCLFFQRFLGIRRFERFASDTVTRCLSTQISKDYIGFLMPKFFRLCGIYAGRST